MGREIDLWRRSSFAVNRQKARFIRRFVAWIRARGGWTRTPIPLGIEELEEIAILAGSLRRQERRPLGRKYGVSLHMLFQSVGQTAEAWGREGTRAWIDAAAWVGYAAIRAGGAGKDLSDQLGAHGVLAWFEGDNQGRQKPFGLNFGSISRGINRQRPRSPARADRGLRNATGRRRNHHRACRRAPAAHRPCDLFPATRNDCASRNEPFRHLSSGVNPCRSAHPDRTQPCPRSARGTQGKFLAAPDQRGPYATAGRQSNEGGRDPGTAAPPAPKPVRDLRLCCLTTYRQRTGHRGTSARNAPALSGKLKFMRVRRQPPRSRPKPPSPQHLRKTHHPHRRHRHAVICTSYLPIRNLPTPRRPSIRPIYRLSSSRRPLSFASSMPARPTAAASRPPNEQAKDRAAWRLVQSAVPSLTDKAAQAVMNSWLHTKVLETRSYRDPLGSRSHRRLPKGTSRPAAPLLP